MGHHQTIDSRSRTLDEVIASYVQRRGENNVVSMAQAVLAIKTVLADCSQSDTDLADRVARIAVRNGRAVVFDLHEGV